MSEPPSRDPTPDPAVASTYRLQLHAGFTFDDARAVLPYLHDLGVTHVYLSPIAAAVPGSTHGYDAIDPTRLNPELGGEAAYARLVAEQRRLGMGQVIDLVPNHVGIARGRNTWWEDVLRHGRNSQYAAWFDIDWEPPDPALHGKVLLPILGAPLEDVIARGEIAVERDERGGWVRYFDHRLPLRPDAPPEAPADAAALAALLARQHYRLEHWRTGKVRVNYRRFFLIDDLVGLRVEDPDVFDRVHALSRRLVAEGAVAGLRVDHPDGLADPAAYLARLREAVHPDYVVIEKILEGDEELPAGWACDGTTGYDFLDDVGGLFVDGAQEEAMTRLYREFTGDARDYAAIAYASRREIADGALGTQLDAESGRLWDALPDAGGVAREAFARAVRALVAGLPVYRTYHSADALDPAAPDAVARARRTVETHGPTGDAADDEALARAALDLAERALGTPPAGAARVAVMRLQQLMPAVQAKGIEDSAFFRYPRLLSRCEVGGAPDRFATSVERFHRRVAARHARWPRAMLATGTHDHKLGEDTRLRISALAELASAWASAVGAWSALLAPLRAGLGASAPTRAREYALYQVLVGTWPPDRGAPDAAYPERIRAYVRKAAREAGEHTSWTEPHADYEAALDAFVTGALADAAFVAAVQPFAARVAAVAAVHGLAQTVLKVAAPGVPDTYQGADRWDLTLVDPDNRRPVDFAARRAALTAIDAADPGALLAAWPDGRAKQLVLARALRARRADPTLFLDGDYAPLDATGALAPHVVAFARRHEGRAAIAVVPRLASHVSPAASWRPAWGDTALRLPPALAGRSFVDAVTGRRAEPGAAWPLADALGAFPVALWQSA